MAEMVERVARAITLAAGVPKTWSEEEVARHVAQYAEHDMRVARAAIEAMRVPTEEMQDAGGQAGEWTDRLSSDDDKADQERAHFALNVWQAMIDEALAP